MCCNKNRVTEIGRVATIHRNHLLSEDFLLGHKARISCLARAEDLFSTVLKSGASLDWAQNLVDVLISATVPKGGTQRRGDVGAISACGMLHRTRGSSADDYDASEQKCITTQGDARTQHGSRAPLTQLAVVSEPIACA